MPRSPRKVRDTALTRALDQTVREYDEVEARLAALRTAMIGAAVAAIRKGDMTIAEAARRTKYSREHLNRLYAEANQRDGWVKPE